MKELKHVAPLSFVFVVAKTTMSIRQEWKRCVSVREVGGCKGTSEIAKHCEAALIDSSLLCCSLFTVNCFGSLAAKRFWDGFPGSPFWSACSLCNSDRLPQSGRACWIWLGLENGHVWIVSQARKKLEEIQLRRRFHSESNFQPWPGHQ